MPKAADRDTKSEILHLAREITQTRSFNWLSYQDLSVRLEIRKASIHYHFPTKADLGVEVLKSYRSAFTAWAEKTVAKRLSPKGQLDAYIEMYRKMLADGERVCPGGVFSLEWLTLPDEMRKELKGLYADHRRFLEPMIKSGRKSGEFRDEGTLEDQVAFIGACLQGMVQLARVQGGNATCNAIVRQLKAALLR